MNIDIFNLGIVPMAAIVILCYLGGIIAKASPLDDRWIPCVCGVFGGLLGLLWFAMGWEGYPGTDPISAAAVGVLSGLAATGVHQVVHQQKKG